mmetsp:Transcript_14236/g.59578  ORF Transcript_14236/g.59578 Transcript_14236/m.59578 type:complete len:420 (+) Transcript_14236:461-1720(+)
MHDGHGAVLEREELIEATRLEAGGHQQDVGPGHHAVRERDIKAHVTTHGVPARVFSCRHAVLKVRLPRPQHDKLRALVGDPRRRLDDNVGSLLRIQSSDEDAQRRLRVLRQPHLTLQRRLALRLSVGVGTRRVVGSDELVRGRVPLLLVDAIQHAVELLPARAGGAVEPPAAEGRGHLQSVARRDGRYAIGGGEAGLEVVEAPALLLVRALPLVLGVLVLEGAVPFGRQPQVAEGAGREDALVKQVVDDEQRARLPVASVGAVLGGEERRNERRLPVVGDEHDVVAVRKAVLARGHHERRLERRHGEQRESELVVAERSHLVAVGIAGPQVRARVVDEDPVDVAALAVEEAHRVVCAAQPDRHLHPGVDGVLVAAVSRRHHHHAVPARREHGRQAAADVAEPARLRPRRHLARDEHEVL